MAISTWEALLAHWTAMAKAASALPPEGEGKRWREAVTPIIELQAVTHALADLDRLPEDERAAGLDRAEVIVQRGVSRLHDLWRGEELPAGVSDLIADARSALRVALERGQEWALVEDRWDAPERVELIRQMLDAGFDGDLWLPKPGATLFRGSPVAFIRRPGGGAVPEAVLAALESWLPGVHCQMVGGVRQVYRVPGGPDGEPVEDRVLPLDETLPAGMPLLEPVLEGGRETGAGGRLPSLPDGVVLPVVDGRSAGDAGAADPG